MKKKILGLALALVMIISLLPLTAFAEDPASKIKVVFRDPNITSGRVDVSFIHGSQYASQTKEYVTFEDVYDTDGTTVIGNKPVFGESAPAEGTPYIFMEYVDYTLTLTFNGVTYNRPTTGTLEQFMSIYVTTGTNFDVKFVLNGENKFEGKNAYVTMSNAGTVEISGKGSLEINAGVASKTLFAHTGAGDMTITDATLKLNVVAANTSGQTGSLSNNGNITINNATVETSGINSFGIRTATATSDGLIAGNVTVNNSNLKASQTGGQRALIETNGTVTFNNSNVELVANANNAKVLKVAPTVTGTYSSQKFSVREQGSAFEEKDYTAAAFDSNVRWLKLVHECVALADDGDCTTAVLCACGKEATAAKTHTAGANADDCTKDTMCGNAGCTKVFEAATATAHTPAADDGDCTTDIKCANCDQIVTKGAEKHVWDRTNCDVDGTCTTAGCTKTVAAGTHTGGTATCKDKAKCADCGKEYGELGACAPAADDGDCTTDIKCSVCGKTTTAGQAAHKYTDKNDTTCDNAGCTNTRKVEGTENPKTGDNSAIAVVAALMVTAAAAFVTTKKFAR